MKKIRARRLSMGLKSRELAERMAVSPARITVLERDEDRGAVTLAMMERAAMALGCRLEYQLVPVSTHAADPDEPAKPRLKLQFDDHDAGYRVRDE